jgi:hypothetical protein
MAAPCAGHAAGAMSVHAGEQDVTDRVHEHPRLIITAASQSFGPHVLALLGSLNLNWPNHPPVLVYDIGLAQVVLDGLAAHGVEVRRVPPFCDHWRDHFTWKIWCLNDAPARDILWLDAGLVVLAPLHEIFMAVETMGYFMVANYQLLDWEASEAACEGCGVAYEFRLGKPTLAGGLMGFRKSGKSQTVLSDALQVAMTERHMAATDTVHRHDQAVISLLMYRHFGDVQISDGLYYLGWRSPRQVPGQKVWVHRRAIQPADRAHFAAHIKGAGEPYCPGEPDQSEASGTVAVWSALRRALRRLRRHL